MGVSLAVAGSAVAGGPGDFEPVVRRIAAEHLSPRQVDRLLSHPGVRQRLRQVFDGYDGADDLISARLQSDGTLMIRVVTRARRRQCITALGSAEEGASEPFCRELTDTQGDERATFDPRLWRRPRTLARRRARPLQRAAEPAEARSAAVPPTIMRRPGLTLPVPGVEHRDPVVVASLASHVQFRDSVRGSRWRDPLVPLDGIEAGVATVERAPPVPTREAESTTHHLRNPFDVSRLGAKLDLPVPQSLTLSRDGVVPPLVMAPDEACLAQWDAKGAREAPPDLTCFRQVAHTRRLEKRELYNFARAASMVLANPVFGHIIEAEMKAVARTRAAHVVWAVAWLDWVGEDDQRLARALASLDDAERKTLRRRLWRWWLDRRLEHYHRRITRIYERHFLSLYPEARGVAGMPKRRFFRDGWLWANNWLAEADRRASGLVIAAYDALSVRDRQVIDGFVADAEMALRYPQTVATLTAGPPVEGGGAGAPIGAR